MIAALETGLERKAAIVCLQEPYIGIRNISHPGYTIHWPEGERRADKRVAIAIRKDLVSQLAIEARSDLISHPYIQALDIWELHANTKKKCRRTRLVNIYDNTIGPGACYQGQYSYSRRAIEDIQWDQVIQGRVILLGDFNAHSPEWNPRVTDRTGAGPLEKLIEDYMLILNNEPGAITRPGLVHAGSIIDLTFTTIEIGLLDTWAIEEDLPTPSDHELIIFEFSDLTKTPKSTQKGEITGWKIDDLTSDPEALEKAELAWNLLTENRDIINYNSSKIEIEEEAIWLETSLTQVLNTHAKPLRITPYSKR
jgi:hypothetical protein